MREPVDEVRVVLVVQAAQHGAPGASVTRAVGERARHALDPAALAAVELVGLVSSMALSDWRSRRSGASIASNRLGELVGRLDQAGVERADVAFLAEALVLAGARARAPARAPARGSPRPGPSPCRRPAASASWARAGGGEVEQAARARSAPRRPRPADRSGAAPARARAGRGGPRAQDPAAQLGGLRAGRARRKRCRRRRTGGGPRRTRCASGASHRRARPSPPGSGPARGWRSRCRRGGRRGWSLDEAGPVMLAGGVDALAAPVGQPRRCGRGPTGRQPGREVAAGHVAVAAGQRPARQQAEADGVLGHAARCASTASWKFSRQR